VRSAFRAEREGARGKAEASFADVDGELPVEYVEPLVLIGMDVPG
jgi:hypothetical protein